jgi:hypothetical protein
MMVSEAMPTESGTAGIARHNGDAGTDPGSAHTIRTGAIIAVSQQ